MLRWRSLKLLARGRSAVNVAILMTGTAVAQAFIFMAAPILSRLYAPADFGVFGLYAAIAATVAVVAGLRFEVAIVLPKDDTDGATVLFLTEIVVICVSLAVLLIVSVGGHWFSKVIGAPELRSLLWWLPVSTFCAGSYQALSFWSTRRQLFKTLSMSQASRGITTAITQIGSGVARIGAAGLIFGQIFGHFVAAALLAFNVIRADYRFLRPSHTAPSLKASAKRYIDFAKYGSLIALLNALSQNIPFFFLVDLFSVEIGGFYLLAHRLLALPLALIGEAVRKVFFPRATAAAMRHRSFSLAFRTTLILALIGFPPMLIIATAADIIFPFILGSQWVASGQYAGLLIFWLFAGFINSPSVMLVPILKLQRMHLAYECAFFVCRICAIYFGAYFDSALISIGAFSAVGALFNLFLVAFVLQHARRVDSAQAAVAS